MLASASNDTKIVLADFKTGKPIHIEFTSDSGKLFIMIVL